MDLKELGIDNIKILPSTPPEGSKIVNSLTMEATVEVSPQPLRKLRPFAKAISSIPKLLSPEAQLVLHAMLSCFEKQGNISEGLIGDLMWGFAQCGIPPECTYAGLKQLCKEGYLKFQGKDNSWIDIESDKAEDAFVRYNPKLLELAYEDSPRMEIL